MSPDRLAELRRQRALVAQHLAWIDAELIAAGAGQPPSPANSATSSSGSASASSASSSADSPPDETTTAAAADTTADPSDPALLLANARADEIIEKYRATEALDPAATKRGCLVLFGALFVLVGAAVLAIYYLGYAKN